MDAQDTQRPVAEAESLDAAYQAESLSRVGRGASAYCAIAGLLVLATIPLDHVRFPAVTGSLLLVRLGGVLAFGLVLALLQSHLGRRHPHAYGLLGPLAGAAMLRALALQTGGHASPFTVHTNFIMLGTALVIPWSAPWSALLCLLIVGGSTASTRAGVGSGFADDVLVSAASGVLSVITTAVLERRRRREFAQQWALRAAHCEARESAERYRSVVETAGGAIIVLSPDGRVIECNREAERLLGRGRDEVLGCDYLTLCVAEECRAAVVADAARARAGEPTRGREVRIKGGDGRERVVVCNVSHLGGQGGLIVCAQDITDRTRVEEALRQSEARLRTVTANAPVILFALDRDGVITFADGKGLARLDITPGTHLGQPVWNVLREHNPDAIKHYERAFAGEETVWVGSQDGATFEARLKPVCDASGAVNGVIGLLTDITERTQAEEARLALERKLLSAQKLESLGVMAGGAAHDFNNLLATVLGNASLAFADLPADSPARASVLRIEDAARRGSDLTRQMLAYAGEGSVALEPVDLNAIVRETRNLLEVSLSRAVTVWLELDGTLPAVRADATQLRQVTMNLMLNATEAIGSGSGVITVRTRAVELDEDSLRETQHGADAAPGPHVCLEVEDTGCGMDDATLARTFDPFFSTKFTGRGLGLASVSGIVRGHRGALQVRSEPGRGTTFRVLLPCEAAAPGASQELPTSPELTRSASAGRTVLLVDDEEDVRTVTAHMLERLGCAVLVAGDGQEGVQVFRANAQLIDAVLIDLTLPRLGGDRAFQEIRRLQPDARVILMSGYRSETVSQELSDLQPAGFLKKPFSVADLRSIMDRALRH